MNYEIYLTELELPLDKLQQAKDSLEDAKDSARGLLWHKIVARYFMAGKLARIIVDNKVTRVSDIEPKYRKYDVARAKNINAFGDNAEWDETGPLDTNVYNFPEGSLEYDKAIQRNYWLKGVFPGDFKAVKAWYRRNAGEQEAVDRGVVVPNKLTPENVTYRQAGDIQIYECNEAWQVIAKDKLWGFIPVKIRIGYEIDNLFDPKTGLQMRYALDGEQLKAPVTWSVLPDF